ncbi:ABC-three component system protein [Mesorhizobium newzealandense]|uniref:ABC-three component system protein n=1 Tax=Mesorhizobium newzealandense TaxID=1300302 RepID=A0ABW4UFK2_9HYPH
MDHVDLINASQTPSAKAVYFVGPFHPRITFYSQQVRALRLAQAMHGLDLVKASHQIAVVGAGAAGSTLACALALLDKQVTLYDPASQILQLQSASSRLLHPHIYEWPTRGSLDDRAGLPVMDWSAGTGGIVCNALRGEFSKIDVSLPNLTFRPSHKLVEIAPSGAAWQLTFGAPDGLQNRIFQHVVLAMGFGDERSSGDVVPEDYWRPGSVGTSATEPVSGASYIVSGNGDGALTETLGLLVDGFEHVSFTRCFLGLFPGDELRIAADIIFTGAAFEQDIEVSLRTNLLPILEMHSVLDRLRPMLRKDRVVTINSSGPLFAAGRASQLNHCMVFALLEAARGEGVTVQRTRGSVKDTKKTTAGTALVGISLGTTPYVGSFKHVVLRHGPDIENRYAPAATLLADYKAHLTPLLAATPGLAAPPVLDEATFELFEELRIQKIADYASKQQQLVQADEAKRIVEILVDPAAHVLIERGSQKLAEVALACEQLPKRVTIDIHVLPNQLPEAIDLVRLTRGSAGKIDLRAYPAVSTEWTKLLPGIGTAPAPTSVRAAQDYDGAQIMPSVDACLMRALDGRVQQAIAQGQTPPLGKLSAPLLAEVGKAWNSWQQILDANHTLRFDFLRWLAQVDQQAISPWDGDYGSIQRMANALIMIMAAHCQQPFAPISVERGNLSFATDAVALGTGCEVIGSDPISIRTEPDDWGVDALILSASGEVDVRNPAGRVLDGGTIGTTMRAARRVSPAIIQNTGYWRTRLAGDLAQWKEAVAEEFAALRQRQDDQLNGVSK